jgi:hypothetical protein
MYKTIYIIGTLLLGLLHDTQGAGILGGTNSPTISWVKTGNGLTFDGTTWYPAYKFVDWQLPNASSPYAVATIYLVGLRDCVLQISNFPNPDACGAKIQPYIMKSTDEGRSFSMVAYVPAISIAMGQQVTHRPWGSITTPMHCIIGGMLYNFTTQTYLDRM